MCRPSPYGSTEDVVRVETVEMMQVTSPWVLGGCVVVVSTIDQLILLECWGRKPLHQ